MPGNQVIIVGGGLAGLSAAHSVLEHGGSVILIDKSSFCGGNSTKATSGINGTPTEAQVQKKIHDGVENFIKDINTSFHGGKDGPVTPAVRELARLSGPSIDWLVSKFGLDLSIVGLMGGHSVQRTHRGKERFPGMTITYALMEALEKAQTETPERARILTKCTVIRLVRDGTGPIVGCVYRDKDGKEHDVAGPVIMTSGGYGADFGEGSLLARYAPQLLKFSTTNGDHCTGDGCKMGEAVGAGLVDMERVQVHPTGLVNPSEPDSKIKFLAAEAMRGTGAIILDAKGKRFCNELGRRNYVSDCMLNGNAPFRLVMNSKCANEIMWHCKHYTGRGLMKSSKTGDELAKEIGVKSSVIRQTFKEYNSCAKQQKDPFGKKFFRNAPFDMTDSFFSAMITPVVHYTMGGLAVNEIGEVLDKEGKVIPGFYTAGECAGGIHGINRLGGNSLLDCVVFGRVSGKEVTRYMLSSYLGPSANRRLGVIATHLGNFQGIGASTGRAAATVAAPVPVSNAPAAEPAKPVAAVRPTRKITKEEVAKHTAENDAWVIIGDLVLDVTKFLPEHPGGKKAVMLFAGKDATDEFDMLHKREVIDKYAPESIIGVLE